MSWKLISLNRSCLVDLKIMRGIGKSLSQPGICFIKTLITTNLSQRIDVLFEKAL
jgi:hypothetical protein